MSSGLIRVSKTVSSCSHTSLFWCVQMEGNILGNRSKQRCQKGIHEFKCFWGQPVKTSRGFSPDTHSSSLPSPSKTVYFTIHHSQTDPRFTSALSWGCEGWSVWQSNHRKDQNDKAGNSSESSIFFHYVKQSQSLCTSAASGRTVKSSYKGIGAVMLVCAFQTSQKVKYERNI